jgi:hypothetical protein
VSRRFGIALPAVGHHAAAAINRKTSDGCASASGADCLAFNRLQRDYGRRHVYGFYAKNGMFCNSKLHVAEPDDRAYVQGVKFFVDVLATHVLSPARQ